MISNLDVADVQRALDALIVGDAIAARDDFTTDIELIGSGGCLLGRTRGLPGVLARFAAMSVLTGGTFGTEVEAAYGDGSDRLVVITRHWADVGGRHVLGKQALVITTDRRRARRVVALSPGGPPSGIWD